MRGGPVRVAAARGEAAPVAFPETYVPAFPAWLALCAPIEHHSCFRRLDVFELRVDRRRRQPIVFDVAELVPGGARIAVAR